MRYINRNYLSIHLPYLAMFSTYPLRPFVRWFVCNQIVDTISWKRTNRFWCQLAQVVHRQQHEIIDFGVRRSKIKVTRGRRLSDLLALFFSSKRSGWSHKLKPIVRSVPTTFLDAPLQHVDVSCHDIVNHNTPGKKNKIMYHTSRSVNSVL